MLRVEILRFAILRPGLGGAYALLAQGILMMYRGSGTVNFAQRAPAMAASYVHLGVALLQGLAELGRCGLALCAFLPSLYAP